MKQVLPIFFLIITASLALGIVGWELGECLKKKKKLKKFEGEIKEAEKEKKCEQ